MDQIILKHLRFLVLMTSVYYVFNIKCRKLKTTANSHSVLYGILKIRPNGKIVAKCHGSLEVDNACYGIYRYLQFMVSTVFDHLEAF